jgi:hypothetical protein
VAEGAPAGNVIVVTAAVLESGLLTMFMVVAWEVEALWVPSLLASTTVGTTMTATSASTIPNVKILFFTFFSFLDFQISQSFTVVFILLTPSCSFLPFPPFCFVDYFLPGHL